MNPLLTPALRPAFPASPSRHSIPMSRLLLACLLTAATCLGLTHAAPVARVLAWDDEVAARKVALVSATSSVEILDMHPHKRTGPLRIKGAGPFAIRALDREPGEDNKPIQIACPIPENMTYPLIVLIADEKHATGLRVVIFNDDPAGFRWGGYRFLNATPKELVVQMENKAVKVPNGWKPVDFHLGGENRGFGARIALSEAIEQPLYTAVWEYDAEVRILCFLVPGDDPRLSPVGLKTISELRGAVNLAPNPDR